MLRSNQLITTAAVVAACAAPATAVAQQDLRSPDARDAAREAGALTAPAAPRQDLRMPDNRQAPGEEPTIAGSGSETSGPRQDFVSPDARDSARELPPARIVEIRQLPSSGFDWGDAGIGAAGMLALLSIVAGSLLLLSGPMRRRGVSATAH